MYAVGEGHEREESPVIVDSWIVAIFNTEPALDLWTSADFSWTSSTALVEGIPCVVESHDTDDGKGIRRASHW